MRRTTKTIRLASYNSCAHNIPAAIKEMQGNWTTLNRDYSARMRVKHGDRVRVTSAVGSLEVSVVVSADIRSGVVAIHQFWGHTYENGMHTSRRHPGVKSTSWLHDDRVRPLLRHAGLQ